MPIFTMVLPERKLKGIRTGRLLPYRSLHQGKLPEPKRKIPGQTHLLSQPNNSNWQPLR